MDIRHSFKYFSFLILFLLFFLCDSAIAQLITPKDADRYMTTIAGQEAIGRWDLSITMKDGVVAPSWLEISKSGNGALVGSFVGSGGSARPISEVLFNDETEEYSFTIPPQWGNASTRLEFKLIGEELRGKIYSGEDEGVSWTGERAPRLLYETPLKWGEPIDLLEEGLNEWTDTEGWVVDNGILKLEASGDEETKSGNTQNIKTQQDFEDFRLHVEFRYGEGANSGIYLRGRYELQILDSYGMEPESHGLGGIYGFVAPTKNMAKKAGEWQSLDVVLIGRLVTVWLNGKEVISNRPIPGITGGAIDSQEGKPGPIMIQGDHYGLLEFRNMSITPALK